MSVSPPCVSEGSVYVRPMSESCAVAAVTATRCRSSVMPGSTTVILRGPLKPRTLVSCGGMRRNKSGQNYSNRIIDHSFKAI